MIKENQIFISIKQFAEMTGVSQVHAYRLVKSGEVPSTMFGTRHCIPRTFLEEKAKVLTDENEVRNHTKSSLQ